MAGIGLAGPEAVVDPSSLLTDGTQLIGGQWVPASGGETIDVINPATGEVLLRVPRSGPADIDAAVQAAHAGSSGRRGAAISTAGSAGR
jgi:aldehyde dehydrogenase (NAD+)